MTSRNVSREDAPRRKLPVTAYAVLGQVASSAATGYEVKARLEAGAAHFWHASYSQVYSELRRLAGLGYLTEEQVVQEGRPNKRVYTITSAGRRALVDWLREPWGLAFVRDESLVKLSLAAPLDSADVAARLRGLGTAHLRRKAEFEDEIARLPADAEPYARLALRKGVLAQDAFARWCAEAARELEGP